MIIPQTNRPSQHNISKAQLDLALGLLGTPGYVPPVSPFKLGRLALRKGYMPQVTWPELMMRGWNFEGARCESISMLEVI